MGSDRDTHSYPAHNKLLICLKTTTEVQHDGRITDGMQSGWTTLRDSFPLLLTQMGYCSSGVNKGGSWGHLFPGAKFLAAPN